MAKAIWNGVILAESNKYEMVEGNVYFPAESLKKGYLHDNEFAYECAWKGHAEYFDIIIGDKVNNNAAWSYPDPKPAAKRIKGHVAFERSKGVQVEV
ncbi:MAG: DUF427 domain-containing protein [Dehalococcoidia bacterium]|nr:DUF427 domain-containing protein [Dehalococcoidia bacterium]